MRLTFGGFLFGLVMGWLFYQILKRITHSPTMFTTFSITSTYFIFFLAESTFFKIHVSGILALVIYGIYLGHKLKARLYGFTEEMAHVIWGFLTYVLETIIFLITGGFLGEYFAREETKSFIKANDIWKLLVFNILLMLARGLMLLIHWPILNLVGYNKFGFKDIVFMTYMGFRGVIGLSLGLIVATSTIQSTEEFHEFQILCVFYVAGTIAFTSLINGLTIRKFLELIDYVKETVIQYKMKIIVREKLLKTGIESLTKLKKIKWFKKANWDDIEEVLDFHKTMKKITKKALIFGSLKVKSYL